LSRKLVLQQQFSFHEERLEIKSLSFNVWVGGIGINSDCFLNFCEESRRSVFYLFFLSIIQQQPFPGQHPEWPNRTTLYPASSGIATKTGAGLAPPTLMPQMTPGDILNACAGSLSPC
jgi:hypothetical protein